MTVLPLTPEDPRPQKQRWPRAAESLGGRPRIQATVCRPPKPGLKPLSTPGTASARDHGARPLTLPTATLFQQRRLSLVLRWQNLPAN